jgi:protein-tyrosine phosphatase
VIDLHCHILPALDDGALDIADSIAMAREAQRDGIEIVCATPHIHPDHEVRLDELGSRVVALNEQLAASGVSTRVATGGEVAEQLVDSLEDRELQLVSLGGGGRWILLEPSPGPLSERLTDTVERLTARGFSSIVAHPERHPSERFHDHLIALVERGALIQVTAALIASGPAAGTMLDLAADGLVHLVASDAHSSHGGRPVRISQGLGRLSELALTRPHMDWISVDGPAAILAGKRVAVPFGRS